MRTVKEISDLTGISVRTLHYYDEIGLLKPTEKSDAGYRLYDDKALETLQQILFFREFDIPLKEIKAVMDNPVLERNQLLQMQRKMLVAKKERMERLITSIDDILKGENKMDFAIFSKTEVKEMFQTMLEHMPDNMKELAVKEFGSVEEWKKHYIEAVSSEEMQKGYAKVVEWYGGKEKYLSVVNNPISKDVADSYNKRIEAVLQKLIAKRNCDVNSSEVQEVVEEYGLLMKQFSQIKEEQGFMMAQAQYYRNERIKSMSGHIVNIPQCQCAYNSSKAGVILLGKSLAIEWAKHGIRVNTVSPGYIRTWSDEPLKPEEVGQSNFEQWTPLKRFGAASEIAGIIVYLASEESSFVTGSDFVVDGGYTAF